MLGTFDLLLNGQLYQEQSTDPAPGDKCLARLNTERVQLVELSSSPQVMQAFRNHLIDAAALTLDEVLQRSDTGAALKVVLIMDIYPMVLTP